MTATHLHTNLVFRCRRKKIEKQPEQHTYSGGIIHPHAHPFTGQRMSMADLRVVLAKFYVKKITFSTCQGISREGKPCLAPRPRRPSPLQRGVYYTVYIHTGCSDFRGFLAAKGRPLTICQMSQRTRLALAAILLTLCLVRSYLLLVWKLEKKIDCLQSCSR
jgi:hypothetical protein